MTKAFCVMFVAWLISTAGWIIADPPAPLRWAQPAMPRIQTQKDLLACFNQTGETVIVYARGDSIIVPNGMYWQAQAWNEEDR